MKNLVSLGKFLALLLRHDPGKANITLDKQGWATVADLVDPNKGKFEYADLATIVDSDDKGRYEFNEDNTKIRAVQGHSIQDIELDLEPMLPPGDLYHGTKEYSKIPIARDGLLPMSRQYVHLSADTKTAQNVANRRPGLSILLVVDAVQMAAKGFKFYRAVNGVWLTAIVPPEFITVK